jgi:two-component system nitrate/nitrite response regulator NarL
MTIRVAIADDHPIVLSGLAEVFAHDAEIEVVANCNDGEEALEAAESLQPDVLVLDIRMPKRDGMAVLRELAARKSPTRVVLLTAEINDSELLEALRLGVSAIVLKETASRTLLQAVHAAANGEQTLDERSVRRALDQMLRREAGVAAARRVLTARELEIVRRVAKGMRNKAIGEALGISEGTVKIHLHSIYEKLGIAGRVELTLYAREHSLA